MILYDAHCIRTEDLKEKLIEEVQKYAYDAHCIRDVILCLDSTVVKYCTNANRFIGVKPAVERLRKNSGFLFKLRTQ